MKGCERKLMLVIPQNEQVAGPKIYRMGEDCVYPSEHATTGQEFDIIKYDDIV